MKRSRVLHVLALAILLIAPSGAWAQFGHPLKGQWSGQWGPTDNPKRLLLDLHWDGKEITGVVNPGDEAAAVKSVTFDYSNPSAWKVKLTAEGKDKSGKPVAITVDGTLENIGAYNKLFHGTWVEGGQKGDFTLTRN
ncbi:MAG TPA: hypothetical protein VFB92_21235 [Vicinamibacterales bacterium]|nr:hypothetical protein [Vicinamibacterales bacterium]